MATGAMRGEPGALTLFGLLPTPTVGLATEPEFDEAEYDAWLAELEAGHAAELEEAEDASWGAA